MATTAKISTSVALTTRMRVLAFTRTSLRARRPLGGGGPVTVPARAVSNDHSYRCTVDCKQATGIELVDVSNELTLDSMFDWLERLPAPEGYKVEIVEGTIFMVPQRNTHWDITMDLIEQLRASYPRKRLTSDVRIDFPGPLNGFACDIAGLADGTGHEGEGRPRAQDVEFVTEVLSRGTAANDYGPKKAAYAAAEVPVYLIVDPYTAKCHVHSLPKDGAYHVETTLDFGVDVDLTGTPVGLALATGEFPRD